MIYVNKSEAQSDEETNMDKYRVTTPMILEKKNIISKFEEKNNSFNSFDTG